MKTPSYIFIVGLSRSGTSLMRRILNRSTQVALCDENFFLGHLIKSEGMRYKFRRFAPLDDDQRAVELVRYIYSDEFNNYSRYRRPNWQWRWFRENVEEEHMIDRVLATDRTDRGLFAMFMDLFAESQDGEVRGEKTPAHLRYVPTIMEWFEDARVIHMVRDPRAVYASEVRRRLANPGHAPYRQLARFTPSLKMLLLLQVTWAWSDAMKRKRRYGREYGDAYRTILFEDLVRDPGNEVESICRWAGLEFQEAMLHQTVISEGFKSGAAGFDARASRRWEEHIGSGARRWLESWFWKDLQELGYEPAGSPGS